MNHQFSLRKKLLLMLTGVAFFFGLTLSWAGTYSSAESFNALTLKNAENQQQEIKCRFGMDWYIPAGAEQERIITRIKYELINPGQDAVRMKTVRVLERKTKILVRSIPVSRLIKGQSSDKWSSQDLSAYKLKASSLLEYELGYGGKSWFVVWDPKMKGSKSVTLSANRVSKSASGSGTTMAKNSSPPASANKSSHRKKPSAPDFVLTSLSGQKIRLSALRGKVVVINFWSSSCSPCVAEMPSMQRLYNKMQGKPFEILAITSDEEEDAADSAKRLGIKFPVLLDPETNVFRKYGVDPIPHTFIVTAEGTIDEDMIGPLNWTDQKVVNYLNQLVAAAGK